MSRSRTIERMSLDQRLMLHRIIDGEHWIWIGSNNGKYGQIRYKKRLEFVHRMSAIAWLKWNGITGQVNHKCGKTLCFNPEHLYIGTQSQNLSEAYEKGTKIASGFPFGNEYWKKSGRIKNAK